MNIALPVTFLVFTFAGQAPDPAPLDAKTQAKIAKVSEFLRETISTENLQKEMPLDTFLQALEKHMAAEKRVSLRIDGEAFGKDFAAVKNTVVKLPPYPKRMSLHTALRLAMSRLAGVEVDYRIYPTHFAITSRERAIYTIDHDVRDMVRNVLPALRRMGKQGEFDFNEIKPGAEVEYLVARLLDNETSAEIGIKNANTLTVRANFRFHNDVADFLAAFKRLLDVAVLMNAQLFEVDRAFFDKQVAPILVAGREMHDRRLLADVAVLMNAQLFEVDRAFFDKQVAPILVAGREMHDRRLLAKVGLDVVKLLQKQKLVLKGDDVPIPPGQERAFLSSHQAIRYQVPTTKIAGLFVMPENQFGVVFPGVSLFVTTAVSNDHRRVRVDITQKTSELVRIDKIKVLDLPTGKEVPAEVPNVRRDSLTASMVILDGQPLLMPLAYCPAAARTQDRVWVLLMEPIVYIEEEQEEIRKQKTLPDVPPPLVEAKEAKKPAPPPPERSEKAEQILDAVLKDVLVKAAKVHFPRGKTNKFTLEQGELSWPAWFRPAVAGFQLFVESADDLELNPARPMLISLDRFDINTKAKDNDPRIEIRCDIGFLGAMRFTYALKKLPQGWGVELLVIDTH